MSATFDPTDLFRFAPVALRQATIKGFLLEKEGISWKRRYFALFGNLLYRFETDDATKLSGVEFLEYSNARSLISPVDSVISLSISTVGGKTVALAFQTEEERERWADAIEMNKFIALTRRLEDSEAIAVQLNHQVEQQEVQCGDLERSVVESRELHNKLRVEMDKKELKLKEMVAEMSSLKVRLRSLEDEKNILLRSRGITPKKIPLWALQAGEGKAVESIDSVKIWCGSWNVSSKEPLGGLEKGKAYSIMQQFVPAKGYDLYVLCVQECVSDSLFECLDGMLATEGLIRLRLDNVQGRTRTGGPVTGGDPSKLVVRGEGALMFQKFIGLAIYVHRRILGDTKVLNVVQKSFSGGGGAGGKGAVAAAVSILGRTVAFVSCQLEGKKKDVRNDQAREIITDIGELLGEPSFHLVEQFHHVVCLGDMSFNLVDTSGNNMPSDTAVKMMEDGLTRTLFEVHDELNQLKRLGQFLFYKFREPSPYPNFFPTYKKNENRPPMDFSSPSWVRQTYELQHKQPFYLGGSAKDVAPSFADRIIFHSMADLAEDLIPEAIPQDMIVHLLEEVSAAPLSPSRRIAGSSGSASGFVSQSSRVNVTLRDVVVDNYRTINDGEAMTASSHSPVCATFVLRLRHDHESLRSHVPSVSTADIGGIFSALSDGSAPPVSCSPSVAAFSPRSGSLPKALTDLHVSASYDAARPSLLISAGLQPMTPPTGVGAALSAPVADDSKLLRGHQFSLLPPSAYTIRMSNFKLVWGGHEDAPAFITVLFPAPFEAVAGEAFTEYYCEACGSTPDAATASPLSSTPSRTAPVGASGKTRPVSAPTPRRTDRDRDRDPAGSGSFSGTTSSESLTAHCWRRAGPSCSGTCLVMEASSPPGAAVRIPNLQLTWKGDDPLDRLHIVVKAGIAASSFATSTSKATEDNEYVSGHCSFGLEKLCKVAMVSSGGVSGFTSMAQLLLRDGLPLYRVDQKSLQREQVTLLMDIELLPALSQTSLANR